MGISISEIADLVVTTQAELGEMRFTDLSYELQDYPAFGALIAQNRISVQAGSTVNFNVMKDDSGQARTVQLYEADRSDFVDVMTTGSVPWRHYNTYWVIDRREIAINSSPRQLVDEVAKRRHASMVSLVELIESEWWTGLISPTSQSAYNLNNWVVWNATDGLNGGNPSGFTSGIAGIDSTSVSRWRNWSYTYSDMNASGGIKDIRTAMRKSNFQPPVAAPEYRVGGSRGFYTGHTTLQAIEDAAVAQNEQLGPDVTSMDGRTTIFRMPVTYVPKLDTVTTALPFYGIDWSTMGFAVLQGEYLNEQGPTICGNAHTVVRSDIDLTMQTICYDRRRQFVVAKSDPVSG